WRVKARIKANLLAIKLFKDSPRTALTAQAQIIYGAVQLLALSLVPMAAMFLPVCLILGQLAQWYQYRPLQVGEEAVMTLTLAPWFRSPKVQLNPPDVVHVTTGPVGAQ